MRAVELFAGAGGLGIATSLSGFKHDAVIEWNREACETLRMNGMRGVRPFSDWPIIEGDVRTFDFSSLRPDIDLVAGGPPCQPFSMGGKHGGKDDDRNLFPEAVRAVRLLQPRAFVFENVKGLTRSSFLKYFEYIVLQLSHPEIEQKGNEEWEEHLSRLERHHTKGKWKGLSYNVIYRVLDAAAYGVPQRRHRVFIVGFRDDLGIAWNFPEATHSLEALVHDKFVTGEYWDRHHVPKRKRFPATKRETTLTERLSTSLLPPPESPWRTVRDAIGDLPDPSRRSDVLNHTFIPGARTYPGHTGSRIDEPSKALKAGDHGVPGGENMLALPDGRVRYFTVRESARIQTFPDDMEFSGAWGECMRQLGNAVPVELGHAVVASIAARLRARAANPTAASV